MGFFKIEIIQHSNRLVSVLIPNSMQCVHVLLLLLLLFPVIGSSTPECIGTRHSIVYGYAFK